MSSALGSNGGSPEEDRKLSVIAEHPRHKRRRRGKKRKFNRPDRSANEGDISENNAACDISDADENEALEKDANNAKRRPRGVLIRPVNVPKAPENSTQFIMEDHTMDDHNDSHLYMSFETPDPYNKELYEAEDATSQDINFMYESMKSLDDSYCTRDFEAAYTTSRYDYYMQLPKQELIAILEKLHLGQKELEEDLLTYDPSSVLEQFQQKLLCLQEENTVLKKTNGSLKDMYRNESNESVSEQSLEELSGNEDIACISRLKGTYVESIESDIDSSVDGNYPENKESFEDLDHNEPPSVDNINSEAASKDLLGSCESEKNESEPTGVDNVSSELASEPLLDHTSCKNEKDESELLLTGNVNSEPASSESLLDHASCGTEKGEGVCMSDVAIKESEHT